MYHKIRRAITELIFLIHPDILYSIFDTYSDVSISKKAKKNITILNIHVLHFLFISWKFLASH